MMESLESELMARTCIANLVLPYANYDNLTCFRQLTQRELFFCVANLAHRKLNSSA
jgi:hypothetical protein